MNILKKEVDPYTAKEIDKMIVSHRNDMKQFMVKRIKLSMEEIGILMEKMRQKHFKDLKNVLVEYPEVYAKYSEEMRQLMQRIMKMRQQAIKKQGMNRMGNMGGGDMKMKK